MFYSNGADTNIGSDHSLGWQFTINDFNFEEERLATAYAELPLMRQQILKLLYVDELTVGEIAKRLNCSAQYVSDQKQKGLKHLRKKMSEGGDENG